MMHTGNILGYGNDGHCNFLMDSNEVITTGGITDTIAINKARAGSTHTGSLKGTNPPTKNTIFFKYTRSAWQLNTGSYDSYIEVPAIGEADFNFNDAKFTIDFWFAFPSFSYSTDFLHTLYGVYSTSSNYRMFLLEVSNSSSTTKLHFNLKELGADVISIISADLKSLEDTYIHVAVTKNGSNYEMYINGESVGTDSGTPSSEIHVPLLIGDYSKAGGIRTSGGLTVIMIDEIRRSNTIRWNRNFTPPNRAY